MKIRQLLTSIQGYIFFFGNENQRENEDYIISQTWNFLEVNLCKVLEVHVKNMNNNQWYNKTSKYQIKHSYSHS